MIARRGDCLVPLCVGSSLYDFRSIQLSSFGKTFWLLHQRLNLAFVVVSIRMGKRCGKVMYGILLELSGTSGTLCRKVEGYLDYSFSIPRPCDYNIWRLVW